MSQSKAIFSTAVADVVRKGLASQPKALPSWLLYDETGDRIFQQIMRMPEYYPTRCEYDILQKNKERLRTHFVKGSSSFRLIELGAGDGLKTEILLKHFLERQADFTYVPVDISANSLDVLTQRLTAKIPHLRIHPENKSYDQALGDLHQKHKKVILFMGANIGNFTVPEAAHFLKRIALHLQGNDIMLIGFDLKKDPRIIQEAYDDPNGLTADFNLNLLNRLNRELAAQFHPENFVHYPFYDPETGTTKSFLVSTTDQDIYIEALERSFHFGAWESIQTEISQKYSVEMIEKLMALSGLRIQEFFFDNDHYFCDVIVTSQLNVVDQNWAVYLRKANPPGLH